MLKSLVNADPTDQSGSIMQKKNRNTNLIKSEALYPDGRQLIHIKPNKSQVLFCFLTFMPTFAMNHYLKDQINDYS